MNAEPLPTIADRSVIDPRLLRVLADPARSFIVYSLVPEAKTVKMLAAELQCPPTRLYHHVQQLEKHGLIRVEHSRLVSGIVEKHYRAVARELLLDSATLAERGAPGRERVEALLAFVFDQTRLEISRGINDGRIDLATKAPAAGALMAYRNVLKLDAAQAQRLHQRLFDFWAEYEAIAKQPAADGQFYAFTVALYPNALATAAPAAASTPARKPRKTSRP
jgi:DNA-binding HxlR family transcriptional regulator